MKRSPFATHRGRLVRRLLSWLGALAVGLYVIAGAAGGESASSEQDDGVLGALTLFRYDRAPEVAPQVADPFLASRQAAQKAAAQRSSLNEKEQARYDLAVATASKFALAYATYSADGTATSYVEGLPGIAPELRATLLIEATARWPQYKQGKTLSVARLSGESTLVTSFEQLKAQIRVQVLQDVTSTSGQQSSAPIYLLDLEWASITSPNQGASVDPAISKAGGAWSIVAVRIK
jgi:hypothetical protein